MWDMEPLTTALYEAGLNIHIETSEPMILQGTGTGFACRQRKINCLRRKRLPVPMNSR